MQFESINVPNTEENRRAYRELLLTTPGMEQFISGVVSPLRNLLSIPSSLQVVTLQSFFASCNHPLFCTVHFLIDLENLKLLNLFLFQIFFEEQLTQKTAAGVPFTQLLQEKNVAVGIKVDKGLGELPIHVYMKIQRLLCFPCPSLLRIHH